MAPATGKGRYGPFLWLLCCDERHTPTASPPLEGVAPVYYFAKSWTSPKGRSSLRLIKPSRRWVRRARWNTAKP